MAAVPTEFVSGQLRIKAHGPNTRVQAGDHIMAWLTDVYVAGMEVYVSCRTEKLQQELSERMESGPARAKLDRMVDQAYATAPRSGVLPWQGLRVATGVYQGSEVLNSLQQRLPYRPDARTDGKAFYVLGMLKSPVPGTTCHSQRPLS